MKPGYLLSFALLVASFSMVAAAEPLLSVSAVVKDAVPESRELSRGEGQYSETLHVMKATLVSTEHVEKMEVTVEPPGVIVTLTEDGGKKFATATADMKGGRLAIMVKGKVMSAPVIQNGPLGRVFLITGFAKAAEAEELAGEFAKIRK
ncbi:SecDF P1 head subdomain-containing protein [Luteolibacter yonseiensis]